MFPSDSEVHLRDIVDEAVQGIYYQHTYHGESEDFEGPCSFAGLVSEQYEVANVLPLEVQEWRFRNQAESSINKEKHA